MTTLYRNGTIYTADPARPFAEAMVIDGARIAFVGDSAEARERAGGSAETIDLAGRMVMPGLHDAHTHLVSSGVKHRFEQRLTPGASAAEIVRELREEHAAGRRGAGCCEWVVGGEVFPAPPGRERLGRRQLDEAFPDVPVYLYDYSIHHGVVNSRALERAGIDEGDEYGHGGLYRRDEEGALTGELIEEATWPVLRSIPHYPPQVYRDALEWAVGVCHSHGITSVQEASAARPVLEAYRALDETGRLHLNVAAHLVWRNEAFGMARPDELEEAIAQRDRWASEHVDTRFVKIWIDGAPLPPVPTHATLSEDGREVDGSWLLVAEDELAEAIGRFDAEGLTVKVHCAGEGAVRTCLNAVERVREENGPGVRHEVAHAGFVSERDYGRFSSLDVTAEMSPALWHIPEYGLGAGFRFAAMRDHDVRMTIGSDWIITSDPNLFPGIQGALQHATHPIDLHAALQAVTRVGAEAVGRLHERGTLEAGKRADFVVLDRDLFAVAEDEIGATEVLETVVGGRTVYSA
ncbi:amidohydrolase [Gulosibacter sp. 10]|uniref:amidohydrolase n=1 Tax=Gulosibacter sp. 10 TaxID=1255570 RepID=UPI00097F45AF|nr:amidohydrolase [Gulosibacter sp. 10]SJM67248.1 Exoenzymes regulatory protein AepA precursor [Gulosibacter sp. 10]